MKLIVFEGCEEREPLVALGPGVLAGDLGQLTGQGVGELVEPVEVLGSSPKTTVRRLNARQRGW